MANLGDNLMICSVDSQYNWPPFNIEKRGCGDYRITIVVAGFGQGDLAITIKEPWHQYLLLRYFGQVDVDVTQTLTISGRQDERDDSEVTYLHRGIAGRNFERRFQLADFIEITGTAIEDGLLHISLRREVPEFFSGVKCLKP